MEEKEGETSRALQLKKLIDRGKYHAAVKLGKQFDAETLAFNLDAHFWFQYALAVQLSGGDPSVQYRQARQASGYTPQMEADILRDEALMAIRLDRLDEALSFNRQSMLLIPGDANREAAACMVEGRILYAGGSFNTAASLHSVAQGIWNRIGDEADQQWIRNNRFHWFRAAVRAYRDEVQEIGTLILRDEPIKRRKQLVRHTLEKGESAVRAYDRRERLGWQLKHHS